MADALDQHLIRLLIGHAAVGAGTSVLDTDQIARDLGPADQPADRVLINLYLSQLTRQGYVRTTRSAAGTLVVSDVLVPGLQRLL